MIRRLAAFIVAVVTTYLVGAITSSQIVMNEVSALGVPVDVLTRLATTGRDLVGMAPAYGVAITVSFLIALPVTALALRFTDSLLRPRVSPIWGWVLGGALAIWALHLLLPAVLGMHPMPATRSIIGMGWQVLAGALGGLTFGLISATKPTGWSFTAK